MSIPPLVCSTPPPPEQCEDEKDIEEFCTNYNLPLDDMDDNSYTYTHTRPDLAGEKDLPTAIPDYHTHHNDYESSVPEYVNNIEHLPNVDLNSVETVNIECEKECGSLKLNKGTSRIDEDNNIEDLDLKVITIPVDTDRCIEHANDNSEEFCSIEKANYVYETPSVRTDELAPQLAPEHSEPELSNIPPFETETISKSEEVGDVNNSFTLKKSYAIPDEERYEEHFQSCDELNRKDTQHCILDENTGLNLSKKDVHSCEISEHVVDSKVQENTSENTSLEEESKDEVFDAFQNFNAFQTSISQNDEIEDTWAKAGIENELVFESNITTQTLDSDKDDFDSFQGISHKDIIFNESSKEVTTFEVNDLCHKSNTNQFTKCVPKNDEDDDDDFGDFDAYQSTASMSKESKSHLGTHSTLTEAENIVKPSTLDLQSGSRELIVESIKDSFNTLYPVEGGDFDNVLCRTLESQLSECWGHLTDIETRQPYCKNWNNSAGQKSLLRALGIDSRNILFGPKWNLGMPRYAANLSASPLQPIQPTKAPATSVSENQNSISKLDGVKPTADWNLSQDSQEFTYAESLLLDLENLMATIDQMTNNRSRLNISDIFSNARDKVIEETNHKKYIDDVNHLPRQIFMEGVSQTGSTYPPSGPFCPSGSAPHPHSATNLNFHQISLPDTHIFTPTDSETPRSQTIHYHTPLARDEILTVKISTEGTDIHQSDEQDDDFEDFQGSMPQDYVPKYVLEESVEVTKKDANHKFTTEIINKPTAEIYRGQSVLEPVKIEPTIPTLNWPAPGEIKETFDDFSEFVSHSDWGNGNTSFNLVTSVPMLSSKPISQYNLPTTKGSSMEAPVKLETFPVIPDVFHNTHSEEPVLSDLEGLNKQILQTNNSMVHDDFNTFQSAKPEIPRPTSQLTYPTSAISFPSVPSSHFQNVTAPQTLVPLKFQTGQTVMSPSKSNYFQMSQTHSLENQQPLPTEKSTQQILQPLSLESFSNSQINWPDPGIDIHQLSRFNPIHSVHSLKISAQNTNGSKELPTDDDGWGDFVSMKPATNPSPKHTTKHIDDSDDWSDFVSNTGQNQISNGVNTISFNVATNSSMSAQKLGNGSLQPRTQNRNVSEIPSLNYVTPKANSRNHNSHFQNL